MPTQRAEVFLLLESAAGFLLLHVKEWDSLAQDLQAVQDSLADPSNRVVSVKAVHPFVNAESALAACQAVAAGESSEAMRTFLEQNLPKKKKCVLGVVDPALGKHLSQFDIPVMYDKNILELTRFCRLHMKRLMRQFGDAELTKFQIGLGHSFSRSKISMDPNRQDKPVQNAVSLVENLDKAINTFAMRVKEWYSWHFPELGKIVTDNIKFAQVAKLIGVKERFTDDRFPELLALVDGDETMAQEIMMAKNISMGQEIVDVDMMNIERFADQLILMSKQRAQLSIYLGDKLHLVAPNLQALVGDILAAKLISHAGSLTNLAKYPASTVQILGAEKALFRALKTKGNTPKYGLLFQSTFIGRAATKNKGRISRYLANKCSLASRIDNFAPIPCSLFGQRMRDQVEARMNYLVDGLATKKNIDVMREATSEYSEKVKAAEKKQRKEEKKAKKAAAAAVDENMEDDVIVKKKSKKSKVQEL